MAAVAAALFPIFALVLLGWAIRARGFVAEAFWVPAEKLTYYILFPALLVTNLAEARLEGLPVAGLAAALAAGTLAMAALAVAARRLAAGPPLRLDGPGFTSLFQGVIRPNTYVGLAAAAGLFGPQGLTLTAICVALVVPLVNLLSVLALVRFAAAPGRGRPGWRAAVVPVARNPLIAACLVGIALNLSGLGLPPLAGPLLKILGSASLPLGLLAVGAGLDLKGLHAAGAPVLVSAAAKLAALPLLVAAAALALGLSGLPLAVGVAYAGLPCAPNAYVLARQMGGDARLLARIITVQTLLAAATLPLLLTIISGVTR